MMHGGTSHGWSYYESFMGCPQGWAFRHRMGLLPLERRKALDTGSAIHALAAGYYTEVLRTQGGDAESYGVSPQEVEEALGECSPEAVGVARRVMAAYHSYYGKEQVQVMAVEYPVDVIFDDGLVVTAQLDLVLQNQQGVILVDHKSTSDVRRANPLLLDGQMLTYILAWERYRTQHGLPPADAWRWNFLGTGMMPAFVRIDSAPDLDRARALERHLADVHWRILDTAGRDPREYPRHYCSCMGRYGLCDYYDLCVHGEAALELYHTREEA